MKDENPLKRNCIGSQYVCVHSLDVLDICINEANPAMLVCLEHTKCVNSIYQVLNESLITILALLNKVLPFMF